MSDRGFACINQNFYLWQQFYYCTSPKHCIRMEENAKTQQFILKTVKTAIYIDTKGVGMLSQLVASRSLG